MKKNALLLDKLLSLVLFLAGFAAIVFAKLNNVGETVAVASCVSGMVGLVNNTLLTPILSRLEADFLASSSATPLPPSSGTASPTPSPFVGGKA
jgi:hypothetical protein